MVARGSDARAVEYVLPTRLTGQEGVSKGVGLTWAEAGAFHCLPSWGLNFDGGCESRKVTTDTPGDSGQQWRALAGGPRARVSGGGAGPGK